MSLHWVSSGWWAWLCLDAWCNCKNQIRHVFKNKILDWTLYLRVFQKYVHVSCMVKPSTMKWQMLFRYVSEHGNIWCMHVYTRMHSQLPYVGIQNEKCIRGVIHIFEEQIIWQFQKLFFENGISPLPADHHIFWKKHHRKNVRK